jgi:hypothetical protein
MMTTILKTNFSLKTTAERIGKREAEKLTMRGFKTHVKRIFSVTKNVQRMHPYSGEWVKYQKIIWKVELEGKV